MIRVRGLLRNFLHGDKMLFVDGLERAHDGRLSKFIVLQSHLLNSRVQVARGDLDVVIHKEEL